MAQYIDVPAETLFDQGSKTLWTGLNDTVTEFRLDASDPNRGVVIKTSSRGRTLWERFVVRGSHSYRITSGGVRRLPLVENDNDVPRRLARLLGWPLTRIVYLDGEEFSYRPRCQGDRGKYSLPVDLNISITSLWTNGNPEWVTYIFVRKGSSPSWEEAVMALRLHAGRGDQPPTFEEAVEFAKLG